MNMCGYDYEMSNLLSCFGPVYTGPANTSLCGSDDDGASLIGGTLRL